MIILYIIETLLFLIFAVNISYLLIFSISSLRRKKDQDNTISIYKRIVILIPAYKEDEVIEECVQSCLIQNYPKEKYSTVVISDRMKKETNNFLASLPIKLIQVWFKKSTKAKALNCAILELKDSYDIALILDADNVIEEDFLKKINIQFVNYNASVVQAHRVAKNTNTNLALLDALSEEINNSIFRLGHVRLGFSSALIGSGMAFDFYLLKKTLVNIDAVGGFDRALELTLLKEGFHFDYLPDAFLLDEKVQQSKDFTRQRRRWLSAQLHYLRIFLSDLPSQIWLKNWDFCDKLFQQISIPRILLLGLTVLVSIIMTICASTLAIKWWILTFLMILSMLIAIPSSFFTKKFIIALVSLPFYFFLMLMNLFCLKGANQSFIHTKHGINDKNKINEQL